MSDGANSEPALPSASATEGGESEDRLDFSGENILALLQRSAGLADGNSRYAVEIAQNLSHQLEAAKGHWRNWSLASLSSKPPFNFIVTKRNERKSGLVKSLPRSKSALLGKPIESSAG
jgi:hypothetical protein